MRLFNTLSALALIAPMIAGGGITAVQAAESGDYEQTLVKAKGLLKEVNDLGNAWSNTEEIIANAETAAAAGNRDEAMKLLEEAIDEAINARNQLEGQKNAGPYLF